MTEAQFVVLADEQTSDVTLRFDWATREWEATALARGEDCAPTLTAVSSKSAADALRTLRKRCALVAVALGVEPDEDADAR